MTWLHVIHMEAQSRVDHVDKLENEHLWWVCYMQSFIVVDCIQNISLIFLEHSIKKRHKVNLNVCFILISLTFFVFCPTS